jgi:hypothetical protein
MKIAPSKPAQQQKKKKVATKRGNYQDEYTDADLKECLLNRAKTGVDMKAVCNAYFEASKRKVPESTLRNWMKKTVDPNVSIDEKFKSMFDGREDTEHSISLNTIMTFLQSGRLVSSRNKLDDSEISLINGYIESIVDQLFEHKKQNIKKSRKELHKKNRTLTEHQEKYLFDLISIMGNGGHGFDKEEILSVTQVLAKISFGSQITMSVVKNFLDRNEELLGGFLSSGIDVVRANQANDYVRRSYFTKLNAFIKQLHAMGKIPWDSYDKIPLKFKYNMDEMAPDTTKRRKRVVLNKHVSVRERERRAHTRLPEGDNRMPNHTSLAIITRADGQYMDPANDIFTGAPPPVIIHSKKESKSKQPSDDEDEPTKLKENHVKHLVPFKPTNKSFLDAYVENNENGYLVLVTPNGSMTKKAFMHFSKHFVHYIDKDPDRTNGEPVILMLDGHASRWNENAINYLTDHGVYLFFHPSHTSIWSQSNDNGTNLSIHGCVSEVSVDVRKNFAVESNNTKFDISATNRILARALPMFFEKERQDYKHTGSNVTSNSYVKTGNDRGNPDCLTWCEAVETLGTFSDRQQAPFIRSYQERIRSNPFQLISEEDLEYLRSTFPDTPNCALYDDKNFHAMRAGNKQCRQIFAKWRSEYDKSREELLVLCHAVTPPSFNTQKFLPEQTQLYHTMRNLHPKQFADTRAEQLALQLFEIYEITEESVPRPAKVSEKERAQEYTDTVLAQCIPAKSLHVKYIADGCDPIPGTAVKISNDEWRVFLRNAIGQGEKVDTKVLADMSQYQLDEKARRTDMGEKELRRLRETQRRSNKREEERREKLALIEGRKRRDIMVRGQYDQLVQRFRTDNNFSFEEFQDMVDTLTATFTVSVPIEDHLMMVTVNGAESSVWNKTLHDDVIEKVCGQKRELDTHDERGGNKRARTKGVGYYPTGDSGDGVEASEHLHSGTGKKNEIGMTKLKKKLENQIKSLTKQVDDVVKYKTRNPLTYFHVPATGATKVQLRLLYRLFGGSGYSNASDTVLRQYLGTKTVSAATVEGRICKLNDDLKALRNELDATEKILAEVKASKKGPQETTDVTDGSDGSNRSSLAEPDELTTPAAD